MVTEWDCVTYSSCEGHRSNTRAPPECAICEWLRSRAENLRLRGTLDRLVEMTNADVNETGVLLSWKHSVIVGDEGLEAPGLDLIFEPQSDDERLYWKWLDASYSRCLEHVSKVSGKRMDVEAATSNSGRYSEGES